MITVPVINVQLAGVLRLEAAFLANAAAMSTIRLLILDFPFPATPFVFFTNCYSYSAINRADGCSINGIYIC